MLLLERDSYEVQLEDAMDLAEKHEGDQAVLSRKYGDSLRTIESQKRRIESLVSQMGGLIAAEEEFSQQDPEVGAAQADSIQAQVHELQEQLQRAALAALESEAEIALAEGSSQEVREKLHQLRQKLTSLLRAEDLDHLDVAELGDAVAEYITGLEIRLSAVGPASIRTFEDTAAQCNMSPPAPITAEVSVFRPEEGDAKPQAPPPSAEKGAQTAAGASKESATQYSSWEFVTDARIGPEPGDSFSDGEEVCDAPPLVVTAILNGLPADCPDVPCDLMPATDDAPSAAVAASMVSVSPSASVATQADLGVNVSLADASTATVGVEAVLGEGGSSFLSDATVQGFTSPPPGWSQTWDFGHLCDPQQDSHSRREMIPA